MVALISVSNNSPIIMFNPSMDKRFNWLDS